MKYDLIVACGDSFTEGCLKLLDLELGDCWPGRVANHFGVPFINFATGGSCNSAISMQPIVWLTPERAELLKNAKNPLFLFNFTLHERFLGHYAQNHTQPLSFFSLLPEHLDDPLYEKLILKRLTQTIPYTPLNFSNDEIDYLYPDRPRTNIPWFVSLTCDAIRNAMALQYINPNATIKWGFIHYDTGALRNNDLKIIVTDWKEPGKDIPIEYPYENDCYNKHNNMAPLQLLISKQQISHDDAHPNDSGIQTIADWFIEYIENLI